MKSNRRELHKRNTYIERSIKIMKRLALKQCYHFQPRHRQIDKY